MTSDAQYPGIAVYGRWRRKIGYDILKAACRGLVTVPDIFKSSCAGTCARRYDVNEVMHALVGQGYMRKLAISRKRDRHEVGRAAGLYEITEKGRLFARRSMICGRDA